MFGHDSREPPVAPGAIPLIGHMVGLSKSKFNYYVEISQETGLPIFTVNLPGQKMYVVTKPDLIQRIQKQHKVLAFPPIEAKFASTICGASEKAQAILAKNVNGDDGNHGLSMESYEAMRAALKPGPALDDMNRRMIREVATSLDELQPASGQSRKISLYHWLRDIITIATTRSVYGSMNPYEDRAVADAFWDFEGGLMSILVGILPSVFARKPIAARSKVVKAFEKYYKEDGIKDASVLTQNRYQTSINNGVPVEDIARYEVGGSIAVLVNTTPAAFWVLLLVHLHPGLLESLRKEVDACADVQTENGIKSIGIDITKLKQTCPLLLSTYQEALRYRSIGTSVREVMEDVYLDQWLLKKGAMLQMPSRIIHQDANLWGHNVDEFQPRRFLPEEKKNRPSDACFRAFGGGKTLCPGRHFSTNEILAVVAVFISRFNMTPVQGKWVLPTTLNSNVAAVIMEPDEDIDVHVQIRPGYEDIRWSVFLNESDKIFALVTEDQAE